MVQKALRSDSSSQNSLSPCRDWLEVRGEVLRPRTALSWPLAKWVAGESEEAMRRTLSTRGPENSEERELLLLDKEGTAGPWASGGTEWMILPLPSFGGRSGAVLAISWDQAGSHISGLPVSGPLHRLSGRYRGQLEHSSCERLNAPAYDSARGGAATYLFPNSGGHRRAPTATSRLGLALRRSGASRRGKMCCLGLLLYCRELLGTVLDSVTEQSRLGDESVEKAHFVDIAPLNKAEP